MKIRILQLLLACLLTLIIYPTYAKDNDLHTWVDSLYNKAECELDENNYKDGLKTIAELLPVVEGKDFSDEDRGNLYSLASIFYFRLGDFDQAISYADATLAIDRKSGTAEDISSTLNNIASICLAAELPKRALRYIREAIEVEEPLQRPSALAIRLGIASEILVRLKQGPEALDMARKALDLEQTIGKPDKIGIRQSQLAGAYHAMNDLKQAEHYLNLAVDNLRSSGNKNSLAITLSQLGGICRENGKTAKAVDCYAESALLSEQLGNAMVESKSRLQLADILQKSNPSGALEHLRRYVELNQKLYSEETVKTFSQFEVRYDMAQKEHELEMLHKELKLRLAWIVILAVLLLAAIGGIILVQRITSLRTKHNHLLVRSTMMGIDELGEQPDIHFTRREKEVILYCSKGLLAKEIAVHMDISERTVNNHKKNIFKKLGIQNTVELVNYAHKAGMLTGS